MGGDRYPRSVAACGLTTRQAGCRRLALAAIAILLGAATQVVADGGTVRARGSAAGLSLTLFSAPEPLVAGRVDLSVLVQRDPGGEAVLGERVELCLTADSERETVAARSAAPNEGTGSAPTRESCVARGDAIVVEATHATAVNQLLYAATVDLPLAGNWKVVIDVGGRARLAGVLPVAAPSPSRPFWLYVVPVPLAVLLFLTAECSSERRARRNRARFAGSAGRS